MATLQLLTLSQAITATVREHKQFCEQQLGTCLEDMVQLQLSNPISSCAVGQLVQSAKVEQARMVWHTYFAQRLIQAFYPTGAPPSLELRANARRRQELWVAHWQDTPVSLHLRGLEHPVIAMDVHHYEGTNSRERHREIVLVRREAVAAFLNFYRDAERDAWQPTIRRRGGEAVPVRPCSWDSLTLDTAITRLLRDDFQSFFTREGWFRDKGLPFRRGYLLYGPPGNGKTSAIRAMLSTPGVTGFSININSIFADDESVEDLLERAVEASPAIVLLEDIDRFFDQTKENYSSRVSVTELLNCLDGASTLDGVIVVATANDPSFIDPAVLKRPGRFDRVVHFQNPSRELATAYFRKLSPELTAEALASAVEACYGFSFAQLQETYILAGQTALDDDRSIAPEDIVEAARALRQAILSADLKNMPSGFAAYKR